MKKAAIQIHKQQYLKVLILEDTMLDVELIRMKLKKEFKIKDKVIYEKALFLIELNSFRPDIILSDFSMPQFTGLEALSMLKNTSYDCPFIIITGALDEETAVKCIKAGADDYLLKDRLVRLPAAIRQSLKKHSAKKEKEKARLKIEKTQIQLRELLLRLESVRDEEKKRISMEIHDQLGQELTATKLGLFYIEKKLSRKEVLSEEDKKIKAKVKDLIELSAGTIQSVRRIAHQLRPEVLEDLALLPAIELMINRISESSDIKWKLESNLGELIFKPAFISSIYRVIQEMITNVLRHAKASDCALLLTVGNEELQISLTDNGVGFDSRSNKNKGKLGIFGMEERLIPWNGTLRIESVINQGTSVHVSIPLQPALKSQD
jgi:signal transduction histidine kinase